MTASITIRLASAADIPALAALKLHCFRDTFGPTGFAIPYPPADLAVFEADSYGEPTVARELADSTHRTWVAQDGDGALVAYVHIGPSKLPHPEREDGDGELYQLYLRREAQGAGLGKQLLDLALEELTSWGRPIWIGVWQGNLKAQHVYAGRGFEIVGEYKFAVGDWRDEEFIMRRK
ncbi:GNAT family N-acetyltransferase [Novosphingobium humi]|uniref:GNAT family N-acetyltransferase n=1 Tax=Novosphingobium humi TaxID=2282397 RepID=UPI0025B0CA92|nr:GNAT family N-acetyltransferase [Novosphingobium humi]WJS97423.1 GNAT family N-acetyltransferase [Novosphingobium humi]